MRPSVRPVLAAVAGMTLAALLFLFRASHLAPRHLEAPAVIARVRSQLALGPVLAAEEALRRSPNDPQARLRLASACLEILGYAALEEPFTPERYPLQFTPTAEERRWAVNGIREGGEYAAHLGVNLSLECWNRYETYFLNRLDQAASLWREVGLDNGGIQGDTFHMNLEEESIEGAFRAHGHLLQHVHLADSNRAAPGSGHLDFRPILSALADVGYDKYLSFELLPPFADPFAALLRHLASKVRLSEYRKHPRGPKKPRPKRRSARNRPHVATARLLDQRKQRANQ